MQTTKSSSLRFGRLALAAALAASLGSAWAEPRFAAPDNDFQGRVGVTGGSAVYPGSAVTFSGSQFKPGQKVQFLYEGESITGAPVVADAEGKFTASVTLPQGATPGRHPVLVSVVEPSAALIHTLKVSPNLPIAGAEKFDIQDAKAIAGVYQSAYSAKNNALFVAGAVGRPPVKESELARLDADTLAVVKRVSPQEAPGRKGPDGSDQPGGVFAVYGVGVDDANGNVWVTNTRQNTVAVYRQSDLGLVKQFEPGQVGHPRDVMIDERQGKAFVNAARGNVVEVFDTKSLAKTATIELEPARRPGARGPGGPGAQGFGTMSMALDKASGQLFVVGANGDVAVIDSATNAVKRTFAVKGLVGAIGIAYDAGNDRVFLAAQGSDNVVIANAANGEVVNDVLVGANALSVTFDPVKKLAYVANRGSNTITVLDPDGRIVATLDGGPTPNHVTATAKGVVYALNKGQGDNPASNHIRRIQAK